MEHKHFQKRLQRCVKRADLTRSDLADWFARPYSTIREWLTRPGVEPSVDGPLGREAYRLLELLERTVERDNRFPIPAGLGQRYRRRYVRGIVDDYVRRNGGVPQPRSAA